MLALAKVWCQRLDAAGYQYKISNFLSSYRKLHHVLYTACLFLRLHPFPMRFSRPLEVVH